jgi:hypothetical protein
MPRVVSFRFPYSMCQPLYLKEIHAQILNLQVVFALNVNSDLYISR